MAPPERMADFNPEVCRLCTEKLVAVFTGTGTSTETAPDQQHQHQHQPADEEQSCCIDVFGTTGLALNCIDIVRQHFGIELMQTDDEDGVVVSQYICRSCWSITDAFHQLYETVLLRQAEAEAAAATVTNHHHIMSAVGPTIDRNNCKSPYEDHPSSSIPIDDDERLETVFKLLYSPEDKSDLKTNQQPDEANDDDDDFNYLEVIQYDEDKDCDSSEERQEPIPPSPPPPPSAAANNNNLPSKPPAPSAADAKRVADENALIRRHMTMKCVHCPAVFGTMKQANGHYRRHHQQAGFLVCCSKKWRIRCRALDHIRKEHLPTTATTTTTTSMRSKADNRKEFGCDICGKFFVTKSVLGNHIRGVHENAFAHMCHICAKTFKSKQVFDLHQRQHLDTEPPKLQCSICGNWLKHEHSLRKHMARHDQTAVVCQLCDKVAPNRHALGNHMRYVHSERSYKCTMCEKAFKKPIGLKEHMASHMGVDLYRCPYCPKTFKSNANMHSHRKKKHLTLWQRDRDQRQKP